MDRYIVRNPQPSSSGSSPSKGGSSRMKQATIESLKVNSKVFYNPTENHFLLGIHSVRIVSPFSSFCSSRCRLLNLVVVVVVVVAVIVVVVVLLLLLLLLLLILKSSAYPKRRKTGFSTVR